MSVAGITGGMANNLTKQQKDQAKTLFNGVTDEDLEGTREEAVTRIAGRTGQTEAWVQEQLNS